MSPPIRAVLFDFGGVILSSPIDELLAYEADVGLRAGFLQDLNKQQSDTNAWARMERGELGEDEFYALFEAEARALGGTVDARTLFLRLTGRIRTEMVDAVRNLRSRYVTMCVTNNMRIGFGSAMASTEAKAAEIAEVMTLFHHVVESWKIGTRKPERRFFEHACGLAGVEAAECVFLDDLGTNLKTARAMGMRTIKVADPRAALDELEGVLGHPVRTK
ncbi:HAD-IA family hydrolase [Labilithrix luteola]|nr:HAD-IA family hydrolase [Labilithrix luteola]